MACRDCNSKTPSGNVKPTKGEALVDGQWNKLKKRYEKIYIRLKNFLLPGIRKYNQTEPGCKDGFGKKV